MAMCFDFLPMCCEAISCVAADEGRFVNAQDVKPTTQTRPFTVRKNGVYFALREEGACVSVLSVKVG